MTPMRYTHDEEVDLNLLEPLRALLEERHVTRAAKRCRLSQPAMSRALERLRVMFGDDLLVRSGGVYVRTSRGERLLAEMQDLLPRIHISFRCCWNAYGRSRRRLGWTSSRGTTAVCQTSSRAAST